ncbi:MAG: hypothetical protein HY454_00045 [Parcubacteria group bacterium]|nr:hypothetical protein [Parcubacteria group bacterium]
MNSIFAKLVLSFALILGLVSAPTYIQLNTASIVFNYKTGENRPLYYLNVKNIGPQKERFDVLANVPWIFISREGYDSVTSLHIEREGAVNFTLDIRPEIVADGSHSGQVTVQAVDVYDYSIIEIKTVEVTFNKNFVPTTLPSPSLTQTLSASPVVSPTPITTEAQNELETQNNQIAPLPSPRKPLSSVISPTILPTISPKPTARVTVPPTTSPPTRLRSVITPTPSISASVQPKANGVVSSFRSFWQFLRNLIF